MTKKTISFEYGALCDTLEEQANKQGCTLGKEADILEKCLQAVFTLRFGLDMPYSMYDKLMQRIQKQVSNAVTKL